MLAALWLVVPGALRAQPAASTTVTAATAGLAVGWSSEQCAAPSSSSDADADGLDDRCEHALAEAFAPELVVDAGECGWDGSARPGRLGGQYLYVVGRGAGDGALRIAYLPAYYIDCGWSGPKCLIAWRSCRGHAGDSELLIVDVAFEARADRWATEGVFLSAHCNGHSAGRCRWYRGRDLAPMRWAGGHARGAPVVWVARGSHANYRTRRECDRGFWGYDTCDHNRVGQRFPVLAPAQNAGSRHRPFGGHTGPEGCVGASVTGPGSPRLDRDAVECVWSVSRPFHGWQLAPAGDPPTPYGRHLRDYANF